jgi:hypothetical protein
MFRHMVHTIKLVPNDVLHHAAIGMIRPDIFLRLYSKILMGHGMVYSQAYRERVSSAQPYTRETQNGIAFGTCFGSYRSSRALTQAEVAEITFYLFGGG